MRAMAKLLTNKQQTNSDRSAHYHVLAYVAHAKDPNPHYQGQWSGEILAQARGDGGGYDYFLCAHHQCTAAELDADKNACSHRGSAALFLKM